MSLAFSRETLIELARSRSTADREQLLFALADLCEAEAGAEKMASSPVQELLGSLFMSLVVEAERDIRARLAEKLARAEWAPSALVNVLALDEIEIARPIIAQSPVLKDHDLVRLLVEATIEHQIAVARRPMLGGVVVAAILRQAEPAVLTALANNSSADINDDDMRLLVEQAQTVAALRSPLSRHPRLSSVLAMQLYIWVGQSLRQNLADRFRLDPVRLEQALADAVREAHGGGPSEVEGVMVVAREGEREQMEQRLIDKLHDAGQLRAGYLVRCLREGRLSLFCTALAKLGGFDRDNLKRAIDSDRPELLALACAAVGIDRSAFPALLAMVRDLNAGRPTGGAEGERRASGAFAPVAPSVASAAFRRAAAAA